MLGPRLAEARATAQGSEAEALFEANLRRQLTVWGTGGADGDSEVSDYANREWGGLLSSFYAPRHARHPSRDQQFWLITFVNFDPYIPQKRSSSIAHGVHEAVGAPVRLRRTLRQVPSLEVRPQCTLACRAGGGSGCID
jgi:hypothetical protein